MAEYSLTTPTAVAVGSSVPFNNTVVSGCGCIKHRSGSGIINVKGCNSRYRIGFHANVTGVAGAIQLAIYQDGEILPETLMAVVPVAASDVWSVGAETEINGYCDCTSISVKVVTGASVTVNTADIIVDREA